MLDFQQNLYQEEHNFPEEENAASAAPAPDGDIKTSNEVSGIEIRLSHVVVKNTKTPKIGPFPGAARVYFMNVLTSDLSSSQISLTLNGFEKVKNGDALNVDRTLFYWEKNGTQTIAPSQVHVMSSIIKSKESLRNIGDVMTQVNGDSQYKALTSSLANIVKNGTAAGQISDVLFQVAGVVGKYLGNVEDKPLLTWVQSYTDINGDWDKQGETDKTAENSNAAMQLGVIVRDADRQQ